MGDWRTALTRFAAELRDLYGPRLHQVMLYGSRSRGNAEDGSDVDTLVVLSPAGRFWDEFDRVSRVASRLSLDYDVVISALPIGLEEFESAATPFLMNVRREGVPAA